MTATIGIDSITIKYQLSSYLEFVRFKDQLKDYFGKKFHPERNHKKYEEKQGDEKYLKNSFITYAYAKHGLRKIKLRKICNNGFVGYFLEILLQPKRLLEPDNYNQLLFPQEFSLIEEQFDRHMQELNFPSFNEWKVSRIDIAWDIRTDQELILYYMLLFKKSNILDYFHNSEKTKKHFHEDNNLYLYSADITINFYDRYTTLLRKEKKGKKKYANLEAAKHTIRLEVQTRKSSGRINEYLDEGLILYRVPYWYYSIIGRGDYYKKNKCFELIRQQVRSNSKRFRLMRLLELIDRCKSIVLAKMHFIDTCLNETESKKTLKSSKDKELTKKKISQKAAKEFSKQLNEIRKLGINPVMLPEDWPMERLNSLLNKGQFNHSENLD